MTLDSSVSDIRGVGAEVAKKLDILGIKTIGELVDYLPRRYDDYSNIQTIGQIRPGPVSLKVVIKQAKGRYLRRGLHITEAVASDKTGSVRLTWFNQPYRAASLKSDAEYFISGEFQGSGPKHSVLNPSVELVSDFPVSTARIVPIYRETKGFKSHQIRKLLREVTPLIRKLTETLPAGIIRQNKLMKRSSAYEMMHFPLGPEELDGARRRLGFEEVFQLSLAALLNKYELLQEHSLEIPFKEKLAKDFVSHLPFKLTDAQRKTIWQIYLDIQKSHPMNRLIEGDVGSGKTVVATMAALMAMEQGFQVALMAPTELLARQHADTVYRLLEPLGYADQVSLLIGSLKPTQKKTAQGRIKKGGVRFMIGTHALIAEKVDMKKLGLVIIDEQHRFGVEERKKLLAKAGHAPHVLSLTATPIPRSLALTLYGELDISVITQKPADRKPIITKLVLPSERPKIYAHLKREIDAGRQVFVVCPLIAESEVLDAKSAEKVYAELKNNTFKEYRVGLLHGRLKADEKDELMQKFINHELDLLVTTTVIEVGVDVPNASIMLLESPERFGLAQIHQLRGRVGRSDQQGYCYLMLSDSQEPSRRLKMVASSSDGFKLAEYDLELRGPGAIYGTMQHGQLDLRVAKLTDTRLIADARQAAQDFIDSKEDLLKYKRLYKRVAHLRSVTNLN